MSTHPPHLPARDDDHDPALPPADATADAHDPTPLDERDEASDSLVAGEASIVMQPGETIEDGLDDELYDDDQFEAAEDEQEQYDDLLASDADASEDEAAADELFDEEPDDAAIEIGGVSVGPDGFDVADTAQAQTAADEDDDDSFAHLSEGEAEEEQAAEEWTDDRGAALSEASAAPLSVSQRLRRHRDSQHPSAPGSLTAFDDDDQGDDVHRSPLMQDALDDASGADDGAASRRVPRSVRETVRSANFMSGGLNLGAGRVERVARLAATAATILFVGLLARVVYLQTQPAPIVADTVDSQRSTITINGRRGSLLDRNGQVLATSDVRWRLFVDPLNVEDPNTFIERLGMALDLSPADIARKLAHRWDTRYVVIDNDLTPARLAALKEFKSRAVGKQLYLVRKYPHEQLAGQVIGVVGAEGTGLEGIEQSLENALAGGTGLISYLRTAGRTPLFLEREKLRQPSHGHDLRLSLDISIQAIAERELAAACEEYEAQRGQVVVMAPHSGEILAMANWPPYDPNQLADSTPEMRKNRCVTDVFEPGSIFKAIVWAALSEQGKAHGDETINCSGGAWRTSFGRTLHDAHGYGDLTWDEVLVKSSNIGMGKVALRADHDELRDAVMRFGFGRISGSGLPGESIGIVTSKRNWSAWSQTSVPMGQEIAVTPIQMMAGFAIIANGGIAVTPTILPRKQTPNHSPFGPIFERAISETTAAQTRRVLRRVVLEGTGRRIKDSAYEIFGKTGTAQVASEDRRGYKPDAYVGSFVGGAPVERPVIIVGCFIHEPNTAKGYYGGIVAAPVVQRVIEQSMQYMGVEPGSEAPGSVATR